MPYNPAKPLVSPCNKFHYKVISNLTDIPWSPNSPDLNPLDFFFLGHSMNHVFRVGPSTIDNLKGMVEDFAKAMDPEHIRKVCGSARTRFQMMRKAGGGHFEHLK